MTKQTDPLANQNKDEPAAKLGLIDRRQFMRRALVGGLLLGPCAIRMKDLETVQSRQEATVLSVTDRSSTIKQDGIRTLKDVRVSCAGREATLHFIGVVHQQKYADAHAQFVDDIIQSTGSTILCTEYAIDATEEDITLYKDPYFGAIGWSVRNESMLRGEGIPIAVMEGYRLNRLTEILCAIDVDTFITGFALNALRRMRGLDTRGSFRRALEVNVLVKLIFSVTAPVCAVTSMLDMVGAGISRLGPGLDVFDPVGEMQRNRYFDAVIKHLVKAKHEHLTILCGDAHVEGIIRRFSEGRIPDNASFSDYFLILHPSGGAERCSLSNQKYGE